LLDHGQHTVRNRDVAFGPGALHGAHQM
jgi:hypothetical protein